MGLLISLGPHVHLLVATGFAGLGYLFHGWETKKLAELELEKDKLVKRRMIRRAAAGEA